MNVPRIDPHIEVHSKAWDTRFDDGRNARGKIGFVLLPNEQTIEEDMAKHMPPGVGYYFHRGRMPHKISSEALAAMGEVMAESSAAILPDDGLDVICYACTSGTVAVGEAKTLRLLSQGAKGAKPTTLMTSVTEALEKFGARRLAVGTPYTDELNTNMARHFATKGFEIVEFQGLGLNYDSEMIQVAPDYIAEFARAVDRPEADAVVISCGALRTIDVVDEIEQALGKPVICSNQAMLWHVLRLAGVEDRLSGLGRLLREF